MFHYTLDHRLDREGNLTDSFVELIADRGLAGACEARPDLKSGINVMAGAVTCPAVAEAHGMECVEPGI